MDILSLEPGSSGHPQAEKRCPLDPKLEKDAHWTLKKMPTGPPYRSDVMACDIFLNVVIDMQSFAQSATALASSIELSCQCIYWARSADISGCFPLLEFAVKS